MVIALGALKHLQTHVEPLQQPLTSLLSQNNLLKHCCQRLSLLVYNLLSESADMADSGSIVYVVLEYAL